MKKSRLIIYAFGILFVSWLVSCETLVGEVSPDKLPKLEEKLVVNSFISPQDTLVRVLVTTSSPIFTPSKNAFGGYVAFNGDTIFFGQDAFVPNATVSMGNGDTEISLTYNKSEKWYEFRPGSSTMRIETGKTYFLTVSEGNRTVSATCDVPARRDSFIQVISNIEEGVFRFSGQENQKFMTLTARVIFDVDKERPTYYRLRGDAMAEMEQLMALPGEEPEFVTRTNYRRLRFDNQGIVDGTDLAIPRSQTKTGATTFSNPTTFINGENFVSDKTPEIKSMYIELMTINEPYFLYYQSIAGFNRDNPFIEPTPVYTNIQGGLGVFAASNRRGQTIRFINNSPSF